MRWISTEHNGRNRAAFLMGSLLAFAVLFAVLVPTVEAVHDCSGENCPVCECIAMCEQFVKKLSAVCVSCAAAYMVLSVADHIKEKVCSRIAPETLVTLKVRLDD